MRISCFSHLHFRRLGVAISVLLLGALGCHEVTGVSPDPAARGQVVTISGSGFGANQGSSVVEQGGVAMQVVSWSDAAIEARVPLLTDGPHDVVVAKGSDTSSPVSHTVTGALAVFGAVFDASSANVLAGTLSFQTSRAATVAVQVTGAGETIVVPSSAIDSSGTQHSALILGLEAEADFTFHLSASEAGEQAADSSYVVTTASLPATLDLPTEVRAIDEAEMEPGFTLFGATRTPSPLPLSNEGFVIAVDAEGDIRWYAAPGANAITTVVPTSRNTILAIDERIGLEGVILEFDLLGNVVNEWIHPGLDTFHHSVVELPNGNLMALATEQHEVSGYPDGNGDLTWFIVSDKIVEFQRDGTIVSSISLFDFLDPYRYFDDTEFHFPFWGPTYGVANKDWTHANGMAYDATDDSVIVSLRNQSMVMKVRRDPAEFVWAIGSDWPVSGDDNWPWLGLTGPGLVPSFQHAPHLYANGNVMVYDNGNERPELGSRGVEYAIDMGASTVSEVWSWIDPDYTPPIYASFTGDSDLLPGGTVLVSDTGMAENQDIAFLGFRWMRFSEVRKADGLKVWELWIEDPAEEWSWTGFDATRIASLYPTNPVLPD